MFPFGASQFPFVCAEASMSSYILTQGALLCAERNCIQYLLFLGGSDAEEMF